MRNTSRQAAVLGVVVVGQVLVMFVRCIDLSVSAVIGFTVVLVAEGGPGLAPGIVWAAAIAIAVGLVNGWLVTYRQVPPFVATFGMLVLLGGARFAYTRGQHVGAGPRRAHRRRAPHVRPRHRPRDRLDRLDHRRHRVHPSRRRAGGG